MPNPNPSKFTMWDTTTGQKDLDDEFITDDWLEEQFVGESLFTWGSDSYGQLGQRNQTSLSSPVQVGSLPSWRQISTSWYTFYGIQNNGTLWACGYDHLGELGNNTTGYFSSPVQVGALTNWKQVTAGLHTFTAVKTDGTLWACGYQRYGQLGNGGVGTFSSPIQIGTLTNWKQVACGYSFTAAVKQDGTLWTWGWNVNGELGLGNTSYYSSPVQVGTLTNWKQVSVSFSCSGVGQAGMTLAVKTDGTLWAWGINNAGQLGNATTTSYSSPIQVGSLTNWKSVSCGYNAAWGAIKTDGTLWTCGLGTAGALGNSGHISVSTPVQVGTLTNWKQVSGGNNMAAIKTDGTLWVWGINQDGQLGVGTAATNYSSPIQVGSLTNWKYINMNLAVAAITYAEIT